MDIVIPPAVLEEVKELVKSNPGQLIFEEYLEIAKIILSKRPCNLLIFGLGNDSKFWNTLNSEGETVFIEDDQKWFYKITKSNPDITGHLVDYNTTLKDFKSLIDSSEKLHLDLPESIVNRNWDIIFVDGPKGFNKNTPGRMKSIFTASKLALESKNTFVIVHDCHREVEKTYCDKFLTSEFLIQELIKLRIYFINDFR